MKEVYVVGLVVGKWEWEEEGRYWKKRGRDEEEDGEEGYVCEGGVDIVE